MEVMTVLGPIPPADLGFTQPHEHLLLDLYRVSRQIDGLLNDEGLAIEELAAFKAAGGQTVVDVTNRGLGRDPLAIKRIALATGVNVVMGCGWYRQPYYDDAIDQMSTRALAEDMVRDLTKGVDGTGARAGIIGEIGADKHYISAQEERMLRAAALAHRQTGAAITTHAVGYPLGLEQLDVLEDSGVDPRRVIVGHCDTYLNLDYHEAIIRRGAYVQYDTFGKTYVCSDERRLAVLLELLRRGHASRILLSLDVCWRRNLHAYGGPGYDYLAAQIIPALRKAGVGEDQIQMMTVENPAQVLPF
ncbi:MAG: phosphotriesterase-related protein [Chloroflexi bacterium]|nr:phosphotriesterase-related protein [Chloroflexota bacterium]